MLAFHFHKQFLLWGLDTYTYPIYPRPHFAASLQSASLLALLLQVPVWLGIFLWFTELVKMRLLTHNMLSCNIRGVTKAFPLELEVENFVTKEVPFNPDFLKHIFPKIEWKALHDAAKKMDDNDLPEQADASMLENDDFLHRFHHALLELHLEEGALICPETGRRFPVNKGIPNMLLHEDEV